MKSDVLKGVTFTPDDVEELCAAAMNGACKNKKVLALLRFAHQRPTGWIGDDNDNERIWKAAFEIALKSMGATITKRRRGIAS